MKFKYPLLIVITVSALLLLNGCATGYGRLNAFSFTGGFSDKSLGKDVWRVEFSGNGYTTSETAQCFWLYRCAELTLEQGFDGFEILSDIRLTQKLPPEEVFGERDAVRPAQYYPIFIPMDDSGKPYIQADIILRKGEINAAPPRVFDARKLKSALAPHVEGPIKSGGNVKAHIHDYLLPKEKLESLSKGV
ncbi:MAG: hypothetical protein QM691_10390 [Opitutaceae bacterium]